VNLLGTCPDLAVSHHVNAFAKLAQRSFRETENAANSGAKGIDHDLAAVEFAQKDNGYLRVREVKTAGPRETSFVVLAWVEQDDVHTRSEQHAQNGVGVHSTGGNFEIGPAAQSAG
jgi:hypothetical protein